MNISIKPILKDKSLSDLAYEELVKRITRLELLPGTVLAERSLVEELGIGRTPVREALQRLAIEGLVVHRLNRGMFVSEVGITEIQEIYEFRSIIDGSACRLAAMRATTAQSDSLMQIHHALVAATEQDDIDAYVDANRDFYKVLANSVRNTFISETIPRIMNLHLRLWFLISERLGSWHSIAQAHEVMTRDVAQAIAARDADRAEQAMKSYIAQRHEDLRQVLDPGGYTGSSSEFTQGSSSMGTSGFR